MVNFHIVYFHIVIRWKCVSIFHFLQGISFGIAYFAAEIKRIKYLLNSFEFIITLHRAV